MENPSFKIKVGGVYHFGTDGRVVLVTESYIGRGERQAKRLFVAAGDVFRENGTSISGSKPLTEYQEEPITISLQEGMVYRSVGGKHYFILGISALGEESGSLSIFHGIEVSPQGEVESKERAYWSSNGIITDPTTDPTMTLTEKIDLSPAIVEKMNSNLSRFIGGDAKVATSGLSSEIGKILHPNYKNLGMLIEISDHITRVRALCKKAKLDPDVVLKVIMQIHRTNERP